MRPRKARRLLAIEMPSHLTIVDTQSDNISAPQDTGIPLGSAKCMKSHLVIRHD